MKLRIPVMAVIPALAILLLAILGPLCLPGLIWIAYVPNAGSGLYACYSIYRECVHGGEPLEIGRRRR